jgi:hypothetical protein
MARKEKCARNEDHTRAVGELRGDIRDVRVEVRDLREQMD